MNCNINSYYEKHLNCDVNQYLKYIEHGNVARDVFNVGFDSCSHTAIIQHGAAITLLPAMIPFTVYYHFVQSLVAFIKMNPINGYFMFKREKKEKCSISVGSIDGWFSEYKVERVRVYLLNTDSEHCVQNLNNSAELHTSWKKKGRIPEF